MKILCSGKDNIIYIVKCSGCQSTLMVEENEITKNECDCESFETKTGIILMNECPNGGHGFKFTCCGCKNIQKITSYFSMEKTLALFLCISNGLM